MQSPFHIPRFRFTLRHHWTWIAGLILFGASLPMLVQLPQLRAHERSQNRQVDELAAQLDGLRGSATINKNSVLASLPSLDRLASVTADFAALAKQHGLLISDATNKVVEGAAESDIGRVEISARLKGAYIPLQRTLAGLLASHEGLALESLALRRARSTDTDLDMEVRFTLYFRKQS